MNKVINVKNLTKYYSEKTNPYKALNEVCLEVEMSEFVGIMGPSGSGKTTLLNMLGTIDSPNNGEIYILDTPLHKSSEKSRAKFRRENLGFIFQDFNLLDNMSVYDNIALPLALAAEPLKSIEAKILEISTSLGIDKQLKKYPYQLSGGQKQRAAIARALVTNPKLILADEPTGALDSKTAEELLVCLKEIMNQYETTIIMVTHDAKAASYCDRVLFLEDGDIINQIQNGKTFTKNYENILQFLSDKELR